MRNITLEESAKEVLIKEFGDKAIIIDAELNELSKLVIKRKDIIKALNKGNYRIKDSYMEVTNKIQELIKTINGKLGLN